MATTTKVADSPRTEKLPSLATQFHQRFRGLSRAHGKYVERGGSRAGEKREGQGKTVHEPPTVELWDLHLKGEYGVGIVPIQEDNSAVFGAIDVDSYDGLDHHELAERLVTLEIPLLVTKSKSGGAHLYLFTREPVPAKLIREKLMEWSILLGFSGVEIFPKQIRLASENDIGNWINMPYFGGERRAVWDGKEIGPEEFLKIAGMMALDEDSLRDAKAAIPEKEVERWEEAPPCLVSLAAKKFPEGGRNSALFNVAVYLRKRYGDEDWQGKLDEYNRTCMDPPLGHREVAEVAKNATKKAYQYTCDQPPICNSCNRQVCLTRKFGIRGAPGDPGVEFGELVKINTEPPSWIWSVNGSRISISHTSDLLNFKAFQRQCVDVLNIVPDKMSGGDWLQIVSNALATVVVEEAPPEASRRGQVMAYLHEFLVSYQQGKSREDLLRNKPWKEQGSGLTWFRGPHFIRWLKQQKIQASEREIWSWLRDAGGVDRQVKLKGRAVRIWGVPSPDEQDEDFFIPSLDDQGQGSESDEL